MKRMNWQVFLGLGLLALSACLYLAHFAVFRDAHHIFIYLLGDIAFVPFEVLMVTLIIHQLLTRHEKRQMLHKLNMVIGAFFSEVGTELLELLSAFNAEAPKIGQELSSLKDWSGRRMLQTAANLGRSEHPIDVQQGDLPVLRDFLIAKRGFLLRLLENPNLLEHDRFTNLLWATFHLTEELAHRRDLADLPETDFRHLAGDINRAYGRLLHEWLAYMRHLKSAYPYLFSLAARTNPFDPSASPMVT